MIKLRPYQNQAREEILNSFKKGNKNVILCLPTGSGKTVIFSDMVSRAAKKQTPTLVLTDRTELFKQTLKALERHGVVMTELMAGKKWDGMLPNSCILLAMVETFKRREIDFIPKLIIIDEAHKGNFTKIIQQYPNSRVIGATATPVGKHLYVNYEDIVSTIDVPELIDQGFLSPCRPYQMQDDFSDLKTNRGEYTEDSLFNHFSNRKLFAGVIDEWKKLAKDKKTIVFNVNIEHAEQMTKEFQEAGIVSECITSKTPKEQRRRILKAFSDGLITVLNNCGILTTGYDEPSIECVIMNRKTKSLPLWLQCCGRGSRIYPGKIEFILLDFGMNHDEHGLWDEPREWSLAPSKKKKKQAAPVKDCPTCAAMLHASIMKCKFCGHIFEKKEEELQEGVMVEVKSKTPEHIQGKKISDLTVDELIELQNCKRYKAQFVWRVIRSKGLDALEGYAEKMGYKSGWIDRQYERMQDIQFTNYTVR